MSVDDEDEDEAVSSCSGVTKEEPSGSGVTGEEPSTDIIDTETEKRKRGSTQQSIQSAKSRDRKKTTEGDSSLPSNENEAPVTQARWRKTKSPIKEVEADINEKNEFKSPEPRPGRKSKTTLPSEKGVETKSPKAGPSKRSRSVTPENRSKRSSSGSVSSSR